MADDKPKSAERAERLAAALRANLRKRKAQVRERAAEEAAKSGQSDQPSEES